MSSVLRQYSDVTVDLKMESRPLDDEHALAQVLVIAPSSIEVRRDDLRNHQASSFSSSQAKSSQCMYTSVSLVRFVMFTCDLFSKKLSIR